MPDSLQVILRTSQGWGVAAPESQTLPPGLGCPQTGALRDRSAPGSQDGTGCLEGGRQCGDLVGNSLHTLHEPPAVAAAGSPAERTAVPACDGAGSGLLAPSWSEHSVTIPLRNHTQNQGFSKVVVVYSKRMIGSQIISYTKLNVRQENGQTIQGR